MGHIEEWVPPRVSERHLLEQCTTLGLGNLTKPEGKGLFLSENILPIQESGQLKFVERLGEYSKEVLPSIDMFFVDGHTESMMIPHIQYKGKTIVFMADLLPSVGHIPLPYVMGYDTRPLQTLVEKEKFLKEAVDKEYVLFMEHDSMHQCCTLKETEKGIRADAILNLEEL